MQLFFGNRETKLKVKTLKREFLIQNNLEKKKFFRFDVFDEIPTYGRALQKSRQEKYLDLANTQLEQNFPFNVFSYNFFILNIYIYNN